MRTTLIRCVGLLAGGPPLPFVSPIFGEHVALQRGTPNAIWRWSTSGDKVRIELADHSATAVAGSDGHWQARIEPPAAGGPYTLRIVGQQQTLQWADVLVGDVWICAVQSNIQFGLARADNPQVRYYVVGWRSAFTPVAVARGSWRVVSPCSAAAATAAGAKRPTPDRTRPADGQSLPGVVGLPCHAHGGTRPKARVFHEDGSVAEW